MSEETRNQAAENWQMEAARVKAAVKGFRWPDEMSFGEAVISELERLRGLNHLSEVFRIVEGATRGDLAKVKAYAGLLADKLEADGEANSAKWLRQIIEGNAGARIVPREADTENRHIMLRCPRCDKNYEAKIGNNPLVKSGLTITPVPLPAEVVEEAELEV